MPTRVLLIGAGAIGAFYGSRLALAYDTAVSALCRSNYKAVKYGGFEVISPIFGTYKFVPEHTFANSGEVRQAKIHWDYIVIATKALPGVSDDSELLEGLLSHRTSIVIVQNGLGVEEPYRNRFPGSIILSAVTIASASQPSAGKIQHNRWTRISIGPYLSSPAADSADIESATRRSQDFVHLLQSGGIADAEEYDHTRLQFVRWHKVAINAAMNPSSVLSNGATNQEMSFDGELTRHLLGVMREVLDTAAMVLGQAIPTAFATPEAVLRSTQKNSSGSKPSMLIDWQQGREMELEVILGNPIRIARSKGLEMPRLQSMYALLRKAQELRDKEATSKL